MIEVEKKFSLSEAEKRRLTEGAEFLGERIMRDVYYDSPDWSLTTKDIWLRERNGAWELKLPRHAQSASKRYADQYKELETEEEIRRALDLPSTDTLKTVLKEKGFEPIV